METVSTIAAVHERVSRWHREGQRVAFVPTMGNLHPGHISLIEVARQRGDRFIASIFVNPMQFGPNEDYAHYPRTPDKDQGMLAQAGCDLMFMPDVAEIYPAGLEHSTRVVVPELSGLLDGEFRPGHFDGVSTVVAKLFNIVQPDIAVFGEKDFQQLAIIRRMVADLCVPIEIIGAPTVRESDGLAMSSRNQYLTAEERKTAPQLHAALMRVAKRIEAAERDFSAIETAEVKTLEKAGFRPDYFTVRDAKTLVPPAKESTQVVVLVAARLGKARLIDNLQIKMG
jgi:pantoate--beta-alanine ligase